jgi:hypothetical protein
MNLDATRLLRGLVNRCQPLMTACKSIVTGALRQTESGKSGGLAGLAPAAPGSSVTVRRLGALPEGNCTIAGLRRCLPVLGRADF